MPYQNKYKKPTRQGVKESCSAFFNLAQLVAEDPEALTVLLALVGKIKEAQARDLKAGGGDRHIIALHQEFVEMAAPHIVEQWRARGWFDEGVSLSAVAGKVRSALVKR